MADRRNRVRRNNQPGRPGRAAVWSEAAPPHVRAPEVLPGGLPPGGRPRVVDLPRGRPEAANPGDGLDLALTRVAPADQLLVQGHAAFAQNRFQEALSKYQDAVLCGADPDACGYQRWNCLMKLGQFELAWQETDRTEALRKLRGENQEQKPPHERRLWNGDSLRGKRVLVRCYHGLGDTIQFVRYIPLLRALASRVLLQAQAPLCPLLSSTQSFADFVSAEANAPRALFDLEIELMELPYIFRTQLETIPAGSPYLHVGKDDCERKGEELLELGLAADRLNVGLAWSSGNWNRTRDIALSQLQALCDVSRAKFFSLQRGPAASQLRTCNAKFRVIQSERESGTLVDTAATIINLDLIITVDTMVAHLAAALGKPVWTLLPYRADWRWMADRNDSPWYPTMRLFRQHNPGDWGAVVDRVHSTLSELAAGHSYTSCGSSRGLTLSPNTNDSIAATESGTGNSTAR